MNIIIFAEKTGKVLSRLNGVVQEFLPTSDIELCDNIDTLARELRLSLGKHPVIIIMVFNRRQLFEILTIQDLLKELPIILVLPDRKEATIAEGHKLFPRFLSDVSDDFRKIGAVLKKMLRCRDALYS